MPTTPAIRSCCKDLAKSSPDIEVSQALDIGFKFIAYNERRPPFDNLAFRQAISAVIDRKLLAEDAWGGAAEPANSWISPALGVWHAKGIVDRVARRQCRGGTEDPEGRRLRAGRQRAALSEGREGDDGAVPLTRLVADRLGHLLLVLWAVATLTFLLFRLMPGDPTLNFLSPTFTDETRAALLKSFGLDKPLWEQYLIYLGQLLRGDFGRSFLQDAPVSDVLWAALPNTVILTLVSLCIAYAFGIIAGAFLAFRRGALVEATAIPAALATRAAPEFWLGMLVLALFAFQLGWFPTGGAVSPGGSLGSLGTRLTSADFWWHLCLPALTLTLFLQGLPLLLMRATMLEVMNDEFIVMARMKGLSRWSIVMRHAARNALLPVVTAFALGLGASIGGNVVIETVFAWPGIGRVLVAGGTGRRLSSSSGRLHHDRLRAGHHEYGGRPRLCMARSQGVGRCAPLTPWFASCVANRSQRWALRSTP